MEASIGHGCTHTFSLTGDPVCLSLERASEVGICNHGMELLRMS